MFFPFLNGGGLFKHHPINCIPKAEWARCPLMRLDLYWIIHTKYWIYTILQTMFFFKKQRFCNRMMTFLYVFGGILLQKNRCCNRMMKFPYVFGGILCGLHKVHKTPRIPSILKIWGSNVWHAASWTFWPEAFYVWHSISYYPVKSHKISYERFITKKSSSNSR